MPLWHSLSHLFCFVHSVACFESAFLSFAAKHAVDPAAKMRAASANAFVFIIKIVFKDCFLICFLSLLCPFDFDFSGRFIFQYKFIIR